LRNPFSSRKRVSLFDQERNERAKDSQQTAAERSDQRHNDSQNHENHKRPNAYLDPARRLRRDADRFGDGQWRAQFFGNDYSIAAIATLDFCRAAVRFERRAAVGALKCFCF